MIVSIIIPSFYPAVIYGGTIFSSLNHAKVLVSQGHTVYVSTTNTNMRSRLTVPTGKFIELEKNLFVKYYNETIVDKLSLPMLFHMWKDIRKADVVHIQALFNIPIPFAILISKWFNKPVLLSPHGVLGDWVMSRGSRFKKLWLRILLKPFANSIHWHATSEQEKKEILNHFPLASVYVIANPIPLDEFKSPHSLSREEFLRRFSGKMEPVQKILVSMGRLQKKKGFDILIRAFKKVQAIYPDAYLFIAGEDEGEKPELMKLIQDCKLSENVVFTGALHREDKVDFLANADLFILPSHNENFGIVYAEALACGTPIVASQETPWAGVEKKGCGKWVPNTVIEIESAVLEMLTINDVDISRKAKEYANQFAFDKVALEFEKVLSIIAKHDA
jgi:glycosyltransferase involved in cell wall biosynthesis